MDYASNRSYPSHGRRPDMMALGLGWMSIALGIASLVTARRTARALGMRGSENLIRACGVRELVTGCGILMSKDRTPWIWGRVAGDALDLAALGSNLDGNRRNVALAMGAVAGVTAVDLACASKLSSQKRRAPQLARDYSDRSGFRRPAAEMRGAASDFKVPRDMRAYPWPTGQRPSARTTDASA